VEHVFIGVHGAEQNLADHTVDGRSRARPMDTGGSPERIRARLGWLPPDEYEKAWHARPDDHPAADAAVADPAAAR